MIFTHNSGSVKTFHVLVGMIGMNECHICGLLFLRGNTCPGCGSQVYENVSPEGANGENPETTSVPPGLEAFKESFEGVSPESETAEDVEDEKLSNLPFGVGGDSAEMQSQLPFGVGSRVLETGTDEGDDEPDSNQVSASTLVDQVIDTVQEVVEEVVDTTVEEVAARAVGVKGAAIAKDIVHEVVHETGEAIQDIIHETINTSSEQESKLPQINEQKESAPSLDEIPVVRARAFSPEPDVSVSSVYTPNNSGTENSQDTLFDVPVPEDDVVVHDYGDEFHEDVVMVDLDEIVEHESAGEVFDPTIGDEVAELALYPAKALPVNDGGNVDIRDSVSAGFVALSGKNWDGAIEIFHTLATKGVGGSAVLNNYGLGLLQRAIEKQDSGNDVAMIESHFDASIYALRQAAKLDGQRSEILFNLGTAFSKSGRFDKADVVFDTLLNRDGPSSAVMNGKASALKGMGKFAMATDTLRKALSLYPDEEILLSNLSKLTPA